MQGIHRAVRLGVMTAVSAGALLFTAAPAQATCVQTFENGVVMAIVCDGGCRVWLLGDPVFTCP